MSVCLWVRPRRVRAALPQKNPTRVDQRTVGARVPWPAARAPPPGRVAREASLPGAPHPAWRRRRPLTPPTAPAQDVSGAAPPHAAVVAQFNHHTEFVVGVEWSLFEEGLIGSCAWDGLMYVWHRQGHPTPLERPRQPP